MKFLIPILVIVVTAALVVLGMFAPAQAGAVGGAGSGSAVPGLARAARTPEQAIADFLTEVRKHNWDTAYSLLANSAEFEESLLARDMGGGDGNLRSYSSLSSWDLQPLHATGNEALVRTTLHWATAVGPIDDVRDLHVARQGDAWKVAWPAPHFAKVPSQVIPVNYLRWDLVSGAAPDAWGSGSLDAPHVRITSMNAVDYGEGSVVMGEVVNEDTIPAFVNINAVLVDKEGNAIDEESSFDKIAHVLLPKQVSPYRVDFPQISLQSVKNVRMAVKATLVPASADPVIGVMDQKLVSGAQGERVLQGELLNEGGQVVNIPHVIATFYDGSGRVVWVADGYVDRALLPQTPESFTVAIPQAFAAQVQSYHVVVNQYSLGKS